MADAPGLKFVESAQRLRIPGVSASLAAFMGKAPRGRTDKARRVLGWGDFVKKYGAFSSEYTLADSLWEYFRQGGDQATVLRIAPADAVGAANTTQVLDKGEANVSFKIYASSPGAWGNNVSVGLVRKRFKGVTDPLSAGANSETLPAAAFAMRFESVAGLEVGDVLDVEDLSTGALVTNDAAAKIGSIVVLHVDGANKYVYALDVNNFKANLALEGLTYSLPTCSRHLGRTRVTAQLGAGATEVTVDNPDGFKQGSLVSMCLFSSVVDKVASSQATRVDAVVDRVVGNRLIFTAATSNGSAVPARVQAFAQHDSDTNDYLTLTAVNAGPGGNSISYEVVAGGANSIAVTGRKITITTNDYTLATAKAAINAHAVASTLVTANTSGSELVALVARAEAALTGGADLIVVSQEFDLTLREEGEQVESSLFQGMNLISTSRNYIETRHGGVLSPLGPNDNNLSERVFFIEVAKPGGVTDINHIPRALEDLSLSSGSDGSALVDDDYIGTANPPTGLQLLDGDEEIDVGCAPGVTSATFQQAAIEYAKARGNLYWLLDMPLASDTADEMIAFRQFDLSGANNSYAGLYAPYLREQDPRGEARAGEIVQVPPTPAVAGLIAKRVIENGVHYPAANMPIAGVLGLTANLSRANHANVNGAGINLIRLVARQGIRLYGARTLALTGDGRQFENVRRWLNFFKASLTGALQDFVFRPITTGMLGDLQVTIDNFLERQWRLGALYPQDDKASAYFVKCDSETTTEDDISEGRVICHIGVSPVTPAEVIEFRISVSAGGVQVLEA